MQDNYYNRGTKYLEKLNYAKGLQFIKKQPEEFKEKYLNMGNCYRGLLNDEKAIECYIKANHVELPFADGTYASDYPIALNNLGLMAYSLGDDDTALDLYNRALAIDPLYYDCIWNYSSAYMCKAFTEGTSPRKGWQAYEYRFKKNAAVGVEVLGNTWDGVAAGESIVVLAEQGLGDKIMFGRYLPWLKTKFKRVVVQCHESLDALFDGYETCRTAFGVAEFSIAMCSLPLVYGDDIPACNWLDGKFTGNKLDGKNIGVVWSGSPTHRNNHNRSCSSRYFSDLADLGNLHSLNPAGGNAKHVRPCSFKNWGETASFLLGLDLVVSVDTSIVHLAGTLGVPTIMVQPLKEIDFRWGRGETTVWYPSVQIVKNNNNWDAAFARVRELCIKQLTDAGAK